MIDVPTLFSGDLAVDDRGQLTFCNQFDLAAAGIRRCYLTKNHQTGFVRAWHGHKKEAKCVMAVSGVAKVGVVRVTDWRQPNAASEVSQFVLSADLPRVLYVPPGYANGWMSLTDDCRLMWFSTMTADESRADDHRFSARYWDCWKAEER